MKYCLFEGGDVVGPFSAQELLKRPGFGSHSLVCPEEYSDEEIYWKEAHDYPEFGFAPQQAPQAKVEPVPAIQTEKYLKEMDSVMDELSSFNVSEKNPLPLQTQQKDLQTQRAPSQTSADTAKEKAPAPQKEVLRTERKISSLLLQASDEMKKSSEAEKSVRLSAVSQPAVQNPTPAEQEPQADPMVSSVVRTISKVNPLEEYFNTMKSGDLGNILGIPDAKENSDLSLSRAMQDQFEKTDPGLPTEPEEDPFDEFISKVEPEQIDEELFDPTPAQADKETEERLLRALPDLQAAAPLNIVGQGPSKIETPVTQPPTYRETLEKTEPPTLQDIVVPEQADDPNDKTVETILEGSLRVDTQRNEIPEPIKDVPADDAKPVPVHSAPVITTQREEDARKRVVQNRAPGKMKYIFLAMGAVVLLVGFVLNLVSDTAPAPTEEPAVEQVPLPPGTLSAKEVIKNVQAAEEKKDPLERAKEIVQNHSLGAERGSVAQYLQKRYQKELQSGYVGVWSAEPLHRDVYVVKYRLAKTRKEPIVYIFQADTAKNKLTGALNNITLDLVGKIR